MARIMSDVFKKRSATAAASRSARCSSFGGVISKACFSCKLLQDINKRWMASIIKKRRKPLIIFILIFLFSAFVFVMESQVNGDKKLKEEITAAYASGGEEGLRNFARSKTGMISSQFIVNFAESGVKKRNKDWLEISEIMAEEKKDEKTLADVYLSMAEFYRLTSDYKKAADYLNESLQIYVKLNDPVGQGNVYLAKGIIYYYTQSQSRALDMYKKANPFFEKAGDPKGQGIVYYRMGNIYFHLGDSAKALEMYDKALHYFVKIGDLTGQGNVYMDMGRVYDRLGKISKALETYDKALPFFEENGRLIGQGNLYGFKGRIYSRLSEYSKAFEMYDKALLFFEKSGEPLGQGNIYQGKGEIYRMTGKFYKAFEMYDRALTFYEKAGVPHGKGSVYKNKGDIYAVTGDISKAFELYDKALSLYEKSGMPLPQADAYLGKFYLYFDIGNNSKALEIYEKALPIFVKAGSLLGLGKAYNAKGEFYLRMGEASRALEMYDKSLSSYKKMGAVLGQGDAYLRKGDIFLLNRVNSKALEMYNKALIIYQKAADPSGQGMVYQREGNIFFKIHDNSKALEMYEKALTFYDKARYPLGEGHIYLDMGDNYFSTGDTSKALEMYDKAQLLFKKAGNIQSESTSFYRKAQALAKQGKKNEAMALFEKSIFNLEKVRKQASFSQVKQAFMENVCDQYENIVVFMLENNYYEKGYKYAESMQARVFLDRLAEGLERLDKGIPSDYIQKRDNLVSKLSFLGKEMSKAPGHDDKKKLKELKDQYSEVENELNDLLIKIRINNPLYASVRYPEPASLKYLQQEVLKNEELLLRYFTSREKIYVFLISKENFEVVTLNDAAVDVKKTIEQYLISVEENNNPHMKEYAGELYKKLFKPLETSIKNRRNIIIVPGGELAKIPFEALVIDVNTSKQPVYLLEKHRVKYIQSASVLSILRKYYQRKSTNKHFIGFGDPVYDYESFKQGKPEKGSMKILATESTEVTEFIFSHEDTRSDTKEKRLSPVSSVAIIPPQEFGDEIKEIHRSRYVRAGGIMDRLRASGEEVNAIAELFKKQEHQAVVYEREKATEEKAKSLDLKEFDYIHFSCHGVLGDDFQGLVLSQIPGAPEDGYLTLNEIMNCDYHAKLVVLSACQTGKGKMERAEGVIGLTRAVMYAGTPAVVASLWNVEENATKELMVKFYKYMLENKLDKGEALRMAKQDLIKSKKYSSPFYWSAFVMYGE